MQLRSPHCPLVMATCQNLSLNEHAQHLLLGELRPPTLIGRAGGFFISFLLEKKKKIPVDVEAHIKGDKIGYTSQNGG